MNLASGGRMFHESPTSSDGEIYRLVWPNSTTHISDNLPFPTACAKHVESTFCAKKVYIIASGSLSRDTTHVKNLQNALGQKVVGTRYGMKPHSLWSEVLEVAACAKKTKADLLITLGAGSLTDAAKVIALAIANNAETFSDLESLYHASTSTDGSNVQPPTIPIISIPTSLSGGEYNSRGGASNDQTHRKYSFAGPTRGPALVVLDPALTITTPDRWWLSTGVRAVDHCVETLCSLQQTTAQSDHDAGEGLKLLVPGLLRCKHDPHDESARLQCQMGVIEAMKGVNLSCVPMGASHAIGHQLGPLGVGHGETSCILLPAVCTFNMKVNTERQAMVRKVLWDSEEVRKVLEDAGLGEEEELGEMLDVIFRALGMPRRLSQFGIGEDRLDALAENSLTDRWIGTNPVPIHEKEQVLEILRMVL